MLKFITILYNNEIEISDLFNSIKDHFDDFKLVISLNSSPIYQISDERVKYIGDKKNIGFANAINRALDLICDHDIVCVVNSDVKFKYVDFVELKTLLQMGNIIGPVCFNKNQERQDTFRRNISLIRIIRRLLKRIFLKNKSSLPFEYRYYQNIQVDWLIGAVVFINGSSFLELGGFDKRYFMYFEDADFCIRAKKNGLKIFYSESIICEYEADRKSLKFSNFKNLQLLVNHLHSFILYIIKHPKIFFKI